MGYGQFLPMKENGRMIVAVHSSRSAAALPLLQVQSHNYPGITRSSAALSFSDYEGRCRVHRVRDMVQTVIFALAFATLLMMPASLSAQADCLACHGDKDMVDGAGHHIAVDGQKFGASIHGSLKCGDCHSNIKEYPHPEQISPVQCSTCHAEQAAGLSGSVHADGKDHPCTRCHGDAHSIFSKSDVRSAVYPLNIPRTCGTCHGNDGMANKHGLASVYPKYVDSIHGYALSKEGLLVAANCQSCHGSHHILSRNNPASPTYKANIPKTCGSCHAKINTDFESGAHGKAIAAGKMKAPVCTDCHTAHSIFAAHRGCVSYAVNADLRVVSQRQAVDLP
jgi:hypothetical protein